MERPGEKAENKPTDGLWVVGHSKAGVRLWVLGGGSESAEVQASHGWGGRKGWGDKEASPAPASHRELSDNLRIPAPELPVLEGKAVPRAGQKQAMFLPWGPCGC